jgi:hypothetical protein
MLAAADERPAGFFFARRPSGIRHFLPRPSPNKGAPASSSRTTKTRRQSRLTSEPSRALAFWQTPPRPKTNNPHQKRAASSLLGRSLERRLQELATLASAFVLLARARFASPFGKIVIQFWRWRPPNESAAENDRTGPARMASRNGGSR